MNAPKCDAVDYIDYLVARPRAVSGTDILEQHLELSMFG
jgi:hypothetical protein